jgi:integrase
VSIRKRTWGDGNEAWVVDLLVKGKRLRKQFETKREAKAYEADVERQLSAGTYRAILYKRTLESILEEYTEHLAKRHKNGQSMSRLHMNITLGHILNYVIGGREFRRRGVMTKFLHGIGHLRLEDITPKDVAEFIENVIDSGLSAKAAKEVRNALMVMLEYARLQLYIGSNPARGLIMRGRINSKKVTAPSKALVRKLIEYSSGRNNLALMIAAFTGIRAGELRAIRWQNIDFAKSMLSISTRMDRWGDDGYGTKTAAGVRQIPLSKVLLEALAEWGAQTPTALPTDLIFVSRTGKPMGHHILRDSALRQAYAGASASWSEADTIPPMPRWHDLRHFAASCWIEAGLPAKAIQTFMGHADIATTMNIYGHLFPSAKHHETMASVMDEVLGSTSA